MHTYKCYIYTPNYIIIYDLKINIQETLIPTKVKCYEFKRSLNIKIHNLTKKIPKYVF